MQIGSVVWEE